MNAVKIKHEITFVLSRTPSWKLLWYVKPKQHGWPHLRQVQWLWFFLQIESHPI